MSYTPVHTISQANAESFTGLVARLNLKSPVLIKPNWGTVDCFTEAQILDWVLAAIPGEKLVIESHGWARNEETLLGTPAAALTKANLRKGERWFLHYSGIDQVLAKHQVEYLNLTEEIWAGRAADSQLIRQVVDKGQYPPVQFTELYEKVPARVYALRGGTLLSLSKYKMVFAPLDVSLAVKNLFGLVTGPSRGKFHGKGNENLSQSIVDINKIYRSLFTVKGIIEAVFSAGNLPSETQKITLFKDCGLALGSEDILSLDAFATTLGGKDPAAVDHLRLAAQTFGAWDARTCAEAKASQLRIG
jgi:uncharacterized protein (DUF362 family)